MNLKVAGICIIIFLYCTAVVQAQNNMQISGRIVDSAQQPIPAVTVKLNISGTLINFQTISAKDGSFQFNDIRYSNFTVSVTAAEFEKFSQDYAYPASGKNIRLKDILLKPDIKLLKNIEVNVSAITIKEDTIEYKANMYQVQEGALVEDILKKLPGLEVNKNGEITAQGA
jgi:hypothetical protein